MSATVTYKGSTLTTVENQTRTLETAGKYLEGNIVITDVTQGGGAAITVTDTTDTHGGIIREITAVDISNDTVTAAHLESGYTAHDAEGNAITGSLVPGITPSGTINISTNGTHDVTQYASASVAVPTVIITQTGSKLSIV